MLLLADVFLVSLLIHSCLFTSPGLERVILIVDLRRFKYLADLEKSTAVSDIWLNISEKAVECVMMFLAEPVLWTLFRCCVCTEKARIARIRTGKLPQIFPQLHCIQSEACSVTTTAGSHCAFTPTTFQQICDDTENNVNFWITTLSNSFHNADTNFK